MSSHREILVYRTLRSATLIWMLAGWCEVGSGQVALDQPPIDYFQAVPNDSIAQLQRRLDNGETTLRYDARRGYLPSILEQLGISPTSQVLVHSKTSFQLRRISPATPRAVYFSDDVYVGWVQAGDVMEFSAVDPQLGANFYTLSQLETPHPQFRRHTHACLQCHGSSMTRGVPGHVVRSVYTAPDGQPLLEHPSYLTDMTSPLSQRWGGWYVSGTHGSVRHLGNLIVRQGDTPATLQLDRGANITDLSSLFDVDPYLTPHSDLVALMVLEHQTSMHTAMTQANFLARVALRDQQVLNTMLHRDPSYRSETTELRLRSAAEPVVKQLLFVGEPQWNTPLKGTTAFATEFSKEALRDAQGRSLRTLDLTHRLFQYPCSYLIYSDAFRCLPQEVAEHIDKRLADVLTGRDQAKEFAHLTIADRQAILEILQATKADLPADWTVARAAP